MANVARPRLRRVQGGTAEEEEEESKGSRRSQTIDGGALGCFQPPILTAPCFILTCFTNLGVRLQRSSRLPAAGKLEARLMPPSHSWRDRLGGNSRGPPLKLAWSTSRISPEKDLSPLPPNGVSLSLRRGKARPARSSLFFSCRHRRITPASFPFPLRPPPLLPPLPWREKANQTPASRPRSRRAHALPCRLELTGRKRSGLVANAFGRTLQM